MINLAVLYTKKCRPLSIAAILDVFESVNSFYQHRQLQPAFNIQLISLEKGLNVLDKYSTLDTGGDYKSSLVLIPAFNSEYIDISEAIKQNYGFIPWIQQQFQQGAEVGSFCTGAFLLAATGLLNGRKATTHVMATYNLAKNFPEVKVQPEDVVTHDNGVYTSGGATNTFHLLLHLVERHCGRDIAVQVAKLFAIDMDRDRQNYFATFLPSKDHADTLVAQAQQRMEELYGKASTVEEIVGDIPSSRRNFVRRFKHATGITPIEYLQRTRLEGAKKLLEKTNQSISEIMYNSGYNDVKSFRQLFKKGVGLTPKEYRDKFNTIKSN
ncbi:helix-turn-helix domain-containing protein [Mucilaginibacter limnophilus]|uniref:Helix-turn-helix domain-containing protein n=1 Tax=Mucilaginibacter limnophilus TaxID=1932778 RepID=A0A3S2UJU9_9SPHI|nr:helix-turn-helix domain-containing protein [Mucilaginibacter limnophilus]RVT99839.1 helix-turn-helix domain-containing protein [Mucilaginibacter limnophilus]